MKREEEARQVGQWANEAMLISVLFSKSFEIILGGSLTVVILVC